MCRHITIILFSLLAEDHTIRLWFVDIKFFVFVEILIDWDGGHLSLTLMITPGIITRSWLILRSLGNSEKIVLFLVVLETKVSPLEAVNDVFIEETRQTTENEQNTENRFREVGKSRRAGKKSRGVQPRNSWQNTVEILCRVQKMKKSSPPEIFVQKRWSI